MRRKVFVLLAMGMAGLMLAVLPPPPRGGGGLLRPGIAWAQTMPTEQSIGDLERRAYEAFSREDYAKALPVLEELARRLKDNPDRLPAVQERIRVCQRNLAKPRAMTTAPARKPHLPPTPGEVRELEIRELGNFDYDIDTGGTIPDDVQRLNGATLRLKGFMILLDEGAKTSHFALVPSLFSCCFGQPPSMQHTIMVTCPPGKSVSFSSDPVVVQGVLTVREIKEDDYIVSLFQMVCTSVKPAAK